MHTDVLSGRGVSTNNHPGNGIFRELVTDQMVSSTISMTSILLP